MAFEINYAESAFVLPPTKSSKSSRYRIFTPDFELPFAGHPTLGTAYHLLHDTQDNGGLLPPPSTTEILLECTGGIIPVHVTSDGSENLYWMSQRPPQRETPKNTKIPFEKIAIALGFIDKSSSSLFFESYPPLVYSTGGTPFLIVAV